jgi:hypothetical protein
MIAEWNECQPSLQDEWEEDGETVEPLIQFLGACCEVPAMKALAVRFDSMPINVKFTILETATKTAIFDDELKGAPSPPPAEVMAIGEALAASALEDRAVRYGMSGSRNNVSFRNPRVCDMAALALAVKWPERYHFTWPPTRLERDPQIIQIQNVWRSAHGLEALPPPERPANSLAKEEPNVVALLKWTGGSPLAGTPIAEGKALTPDTVIEMFVLLHRALPEGVAGFDFVAERAGDRRGFIVTVTWISQPSAPPSNGWSTSTDIELDDQSFYDSSGGYSATDYRTGASGFDEEKRALTKAFAGKADQSIAISYSARLTKD